MEITAERLQEILLAHSQWVTGSGGAGADLTGADLTGADLTGAYLTGANLTDADLTGADLTGADLTGAYLTGANLTGANLTGAYLTDADLTDANLTDADGEKIEIKKAPVHIANLRWFVTVWYSHMQIGCEFHSHSDWSSFDDERIKKMDPNALEFWNEWKEILLAICKKHGE